MAVKTPADFIDAPRQKPASGSARHGASVPRSKKKSKKGLLAAAVVLIVLLLGLTAVFLPQALNKYRTNESSEMDGALGLAESGQKADLDKKFEPKNDKKPENTPKPKLEKKPEKPPAETVKPVEKKEFPPEMFSKQIVPLLSKYCTECHGGAKPKGKLALDVYKDEASVVKDRKVWEGVVKKLRAKEMPPEGKPRPKSAELDSLTAWIDALLEKADIASKKDPGRVTLRRLNRTEYNNTIHDLVGVDFKPAADFPADDVGYGFDNIGDVLSLPPLLMEKYLHAADQIVVAAFAKPELRKQIMIAQPTEKLKSRDAARKILEQFASRAYRRPVTNEEMNRLLSLVKKIETQGGNDVFEKTIQQALKAVLISPHFLFRVEIDREPNNPNAVHAINAYELASRLSYFLWSSMPDEDLFKEAKENTLANNLEAQVERMLQSPKSRALVNNFAGQWLQTRALQTVTPDKVRFPSFDESLRSAMVRETELFFQAVMREDRSVIELLDADFTFVNERLARHYGIEGIKGNEFRRVQLKDGQRGGVLTQASVLTVTSNPTRTSPVKRGKWILENILGTPPPPPPPDVKDLDNTKEAVASGSLRKRMEQHRSNALCASCHQKMDPLGFGLENFDAVGAWRTKDGKFPVDASGTLPDGRSFKGPRELKAILIKQKDDFARCLSEKLLTYALGRGLETYDKREVDSIAAALAKNDYKFSTLVREIVKSDPFQKRRGQEVKK